LEYNQSINCKLENEGCHNFIEICRTANQKSTDLQTCILDVQKLENAYILKYVEITYFN